eukprot:4249676-Amphidinium_carterae.1
MMRLAKQQHASQDTGALLVIGQHTAQVDTEGQSVTCTRWGKYTKWSRRGGLAKALCFVNQDVTVVDASCGEEATQCFP